MGIYDDFEDGDLNGGQKNYIDQAGTHYLTLAEYDHLDGKYDEKTGRGFSGRVGPLFLFDVAQSNAWPKGERVGTQIDPTIKGGNAEKTKQVRKFQMQEIGDIVRALMDSSGASDEDIDGLTVAMLAKILPNVDKFGSLFVGKTIKCVATPSKKDGYVNRKWYGDDR